MPQYICIHFCHMLFILYETWMLFFSLFRKQIYYDYKDDNDDGENKNRRQKFKQQKKCPLPKSKVIQVTNQ